MFVSAEKLSKKKQKERNRERRVTWQFNPADRIVPSRKVYNRKRLDKICYI